MVLAKIILYLLQDEHHEHSSTFSCNDSGLLMWHPDRDTRLLSCRLSFFFWLAPMLLPLSPKGKYFFPGVAEQPSI